MRSRNGESTLDGGLQGILLGIFLRLTSLQFSSRQDKSGLRTLFTPLRLIRHDVCASSAAVCIVVTTVWLGHESI